MASGWNWTQDSEQKALGLRWGAKPGEEHRDTWQRAVELKEAVAYPPACLHLAFRSFRNPSGIFPPLWFLQEHTLYLFTLTTPLPDSQGDSLPRISDSVGAWLVNVNTHRSMGAHSPLQLCDSAERDLFINSGFSQQMSFLQPYHQHVIMSDMIWGGRMGLMTSEIQAGQVELATSRIHTKLALYQSTPVTSFVYPLPSFLSCIKKTLNHLNLMWV